MANRPSLDFLQQIASGDLDVTTLPSRLLADAHYFWTVRYDEHYTPEEGAMIIDALQRIQQELLSRLEAMQSHG